jgi:hypothetical protein
MWEVDRKLLLACHSTVVSFAIIFAIIARIFGVPHHSLDHRKQFAKETAFIDAAMGTRCQSAGQEKCGIVLAHHYDFGNPLAKKACNFQPV